MSEYVYAGSTSQTIDIFLQDSSSTTGAGLAGLVFNSAGLVASYRKGATGSRVAITLATQTVGGAWTSGGFVEIEATHMKGVYRFDIPDAAIDTAGFITLYFYGATNLLPTPMRIDCRALPASVKDIAANAVTASALAADAVTEIQNGLSTQASVDAVAVQLVDILSLVESVALTGAATYMAASSSTLTTGTLSSGTYANTFTADGISHVHTDAAGSIEVIYDYEMGASAVAIEALFRGRVTGSNDTILVQAYDWIGTDWETIWSQAGTNGTVATDRAEPLLAKHTGTGADDGKVRIRFYAASGLSSATLYVDQLLVAKTVTQVDLTAGALSQINAEVLDVLQTDTFAELSAPPAATSSLKDKLTWLFMWARNKSTQTSGERKLYADNTSTVVGTETVTDDGTTYTKGEAS